MSYPICKICGGSGEGVEFNIFNPVIPPFGTACVACEEKIKKGDIEKPEVEEGVTK